MAPAEGRPATRIEPPPGFWQREVSHYPKPLTPLGASLALDGINQAFPKMFEEFGLLIRTFEFREIGGYVYQSARPLASSGSGRLPPVPVLWLLARIVPVFRRRIARCKQVMRGGLDRATIERWYSEWRPRLITQIGELRAVDLGAFTDEELAAHLVRLRRWFFEACDIHFYLNPANAFPLARLAFFCRDHLGYDEMQMLRLLSGLSDASSEPALALARLADRIKVDKDLRSLLLAAAPESVASLLDERGDELATAFREYVDRYGCRALRYEVVEQCLSEQPGLIGRLLQDQLRSDVDLKTAQERLARERDEAKAGALTALPDESRRREFVALLDAAARAYPVREDGEFYTTSVPLALCRFAVLEAAQRLLRRSAIAVADDVFFLRFDELVAALAGGSRPSGEMIAARRDQLRAAEAFDPPVSFGEEAPLPPLNVLPREAREAMEAMIFMRDHVFEPERSNLRIDLATREISGRAASKGTYTGTARIIMGEHQFDRLKAGDVLVCPITSPVWSILFANVGALVTDAGGILSHPAIIAREYGIPAVVATGNATQIITDGQQVVVDGDHGIVRIVV